MKGGCQHHYPRTTSLSLVTLVASALVACSTSAEGRFYEEREDACRVSSELEGSYESPGPSFEATSGKCVDLARELERSSDETSFTLKMRDEDTFESRHGAAAPNTYRLDADRCLLVRTSTQTLATKDLDGNAVKVELSSVVTVRASGGRLSGERIIEVTSDTTGAKGFPCTIRGRDVAVRR